MNYKHGHGTVQQSSTYRSWAAMKRRCDNYAADNYKFYGERGITYDRRWDDFSVFLEDMGERPDGTTLDRIESNKGYYKDNCRWATKKQQMRNRAMKLTARQVVLIKGLLAAKSPAIGICKFARAIAPSFGISYNTVRRIYNDPSYRSLVDGDLGE
jgi:hypothetical protein